MHTPHNIARLIAAARDAHALLQRIQPTPWPHEEHPERIALGDALAALDRPEHREQQQALPL